MSETVTTPAETTVETVAPVAATPTEPVLPANDNGVKIDSAIDRAVLLLTAANGLPPAERTELDNRAITQIGRHLTQKWGAQDVKLHLETLPAYGESGKGSLRYTKQRAALMIALAGMNGCVAELAYTKYTYPNPNTGRRNYHVNVWGAECDLDRVRALFSVLQARVIKDGYTDAIVPMPKDARPADQTKIRREFFARFANQVADQFGPVLDEMASTRKVEGLISDRQTAAEAAQSAHHLTTTEETASTNE